MTTRYPWLRQIVTQGLMVLFALGAMAASRRPFAEFGFRRPVPARGHFLLWGLLLGASSTGLILALGLKGLSERVQAYGLLGLVLCIWIFSSVVEEIFCRGWFQTLSTPSENDSGGKSTNAAVVWSAALFGSMHLSLLFGGAEVASVAVIVVAVSVLGYVCALARARTGSLQPAILAHVMFNVGGFLAGVCYVIAYRVSTGHMPSM